MASFLSSPAAGTPLRRLPVGTLHLVFALALLSGGVPVRPAAGAPPVHLVMEPRDPLLPMLSRVRRFLHQNEVDGVVMDSRYVVSPSEAIRMSVVSQLLGDVEMARVAPSEAVEQDIVDRADFLIARLDTVSSHTPFDGMLAYGLLGAFEMTGESRFMDAGRTVAEALMAIPTEQCVLNGGLMAAMAMAEFQRLTGDPVAGRKASDIIGLLPPYQHADGSFPHWCFGSRDIHYTGWMAMELIHLQRLTGDPRIAPILGRMADFLEARLDSSGMSRYEEPCADGSGCTEYYYSRATGCGYDYDTRSWTVEPAYTTLALAHVNSPAYARVVRFLERLERGGTWSDLWDHFPPPSDPEYPWTVADTSVANTSIIYWALATIASTPQGGVLPPTAVTTRAGPIGGGQAQAGSASLRGAWPQPARGPCELRLELRRATQGSLSLLDTQGRRLRVLAEGRLPAGVFMLAWDRRDDRGSRVQPGVYFAVLDLGAERHVARLIVLR